MSYGWSFGTFDGAALQRWTAGGLSLDDEARLVDAVLWSPTRDAFPAGEHDELRKVLHGLAREGARATFRDAGDARRELLDRLIAALVAEGGFAELGGKRCSDFVLGTEELEGLIRCAEPEAKVAGTLLREGRRFVTDEPCRCALLTPDEGRAVAQELRGALRRLPAAGPPPVERPPGLVDRLLAVFGAAGTSSPAPRTLDEGGRAALASTLAVMGERCTGGQWVLARLD